MFCHNLGSSLRTQLCDSMGSPWPLPENINQSASCNNILLNTQSCIQYMANFCHHSRTVLTTWLHIISEYNNTHKCPSIKLQTSDHTQTACLMLCTFPVEYIQAFIWIKSCYNNCCTWPIKIYSTLMMHFEPKSKITVNYMIAHSHKMFWYSLN